MKFKIILILFFTASLSVFAEGSSNYSIFGIGDIEQSGNAAFNGMGGASIAVPMKSAVNLNNPAMWSYNTNTRFQISYKQNQSIISNANQSALQTNGSFDGIQVMFSIDTARGIAAGLGFNANTTQNYYVSNDMSYKLDSLTASGKAYYSGIGGLTNFYLGSSFRLVDNLTLGAYGKVYFGTTQDVVSTYFFENYSFNTATVLRRSYSGATYRIGLGYKYQDLTLGSFYEGAANMTSDLTKSYQSAVNPDTSFTSSEDFIIPASMGFGASYLSGKFLFAADYKMQDFSNFTFKKRDNVEYIPSYGINVGVLRAGNTQVGADYLDKVSYKFGGGYNQLYYKVNGVNITEFYGTLGASLPLPGTGILDVSGQFGKRGETSAGLIQEVFLRFNFSLSIGETWFQPFRRD